MHATLEEELFYSALHGRVKPSILALEPPTAEEDTKDEDLMTEALEEHREVNILIATLRAPDSGDAQVQSKAA
jgi:hypothetical protein